MRKTFYSTYSRSFRETCPWITRYNSVYYSSLLANPTLPYSSFGSPEDVQESISCGIYILRLWKKVLELKKLRLHSQPRANSDPSKRGHFITYNGGYTTAEVLFAVGSIHQLAMYLHFKGLGPQWASPYNFDTKSTERIIAEMQGKTNELQSLDSQPTFGDMLDRSKKVQFDINAKQRLATAGANVVSSQKRKRLALTFKLKKGEEGYDNYCDFKEAQSKAHRRVHTLFFFLIMCT